eukprot:TRINITY_DN8173_c0_g1_i2.p1 TRINITY_DN8173_c0_g1~~TRINITY_DN8173_c0_g1_i2.p1  ORF type:complete len:129 (+),score=49.29 TRINITY_DN8173_c0_g1_i2:26-412(+)
MKKNVMKLQKEGDLEDDKLVVRAQSSFEKQRERSWRLKKKEREAEAKGKAAGFQNHHRSKKPTTGRKVRDELRDPEQVLKARAKSKDIRIKNMERGKKKAFKQRGEAGGMRGGNRGGKSGGRGGKRKG